MVKKVAKRTVRSAKSTKNKAIKYDPRPILCHPSTWIAAVLGLALLVVSGLSVYALNQSHIPSKLESSELNIFDHLAKMYIHDMEFEVNDQPTIKQATGYGVSDEDDVLYITFDFVPYTVEDNNRVPQGDMRHGIIYFKWDPNQNTYGHAFSYHDDASYHPEGTYVEFEDDFLNTILTQ